MKRGFTLVELLVVIAIISILTMVTVSQFQTAKKKANDVARKGDLSALSKALMMYYADYGKFPTASIDGKLQITDSGKAVGFNTPDWGAEFHDNAETSYVYMKVMPKEKILTSYPFCYATDAGGSKFSLFAMLENTTDSQCVMTGGVGTYHQCGRDYCFSYVSPNAAVTDFPASVP